MHMKEFERFKKKLLREHILKAVLVGLGVGLFGAGLAVLLFRLVAPSAAVVAGIVAGVVFAGLAFALYFRGARPSDKEIALRLDKDLGLREKTATMVEFEGQDNLILEKQREDARSSLAAKPTAALKFNVSVLGVIALVVGGGGFASSLLLPVHQLNHDDQPGENSSNNWDSIVDSIVKSVDNDIENNDSINKSLGDEIQSILDELQNSLEGNTNVEERSSLVDEAKSKIDEAVDNANTKEEIGEALKHQEDQALQDLGQALIDGDNQAVNDALQELMDEFNAIDDPKELAEKMHDIADQIRDALEEAKENGVDPNDGLYKSLENLANRLDGQAEKLENSEQEQQEQQVILAYTTSYAGDVYLHDVSYTDFDGKDWSAPIAYDTPAGASNPLYYTADKLENAGITTYSMDLDWDADYLAALAQYGYSPRNLLPLYATTEFAADATDAYLTETFAAHQEYHFHPYALTAATAAQLEAASYSKSATTTAEASYRSFVRSNYLTVSADEKAYFDTVIASENLDDSIDGMLSATDYIMNAAEYDIEYVEGGSKTYDGDDHILDFLQDKKAGVCVQFAGALTLLLRSLGVPARYTEGWQSVATGDITKPVEVTEIGHAWTEAYIDNIGWVVLDATPAQNGEGQGEEHSSNPASKARRTKTRKMPKTPRKKRSIAPSSR